jgi:hypothetical protein
MKNLITLIFACVLPLALAACDSGQAASSAAQAPSPPRQAPENADAARTSPEASAVAMPGQDNGEAVKALVVYYSWSGNTRVGVAKKK